MSTDNPEADRKPVRPPSAKVLALMDRSMELSHAVQTGVLAMMHLSARDAATEPKHLRTGINTLKCDISALVKTLVDAGFISDEAYFTNLNLMLEQEVAMYTERVRQITGNPNISLG